MLANLIFALILFFSTAAYAQAPKTRCIKSATQHISRLVPLDVDSARALGWQGSGTGLTVKIVPDVSDNGNQNPGQFRLAYYYPDYTEARYTSYADPHLATIQYKGPAQSCQSQ